MIFCTNYYEAEAWTEGAGSAYQREIYAYWLASLMGYSFHKLPFLLNSKHEVTNISQHISPFVWQEIFDFFGTQISPIEFSRLNTQDLSFIPFRVAEHHLRLLEDLEWANLIKSFRQNFNEHNRLQINRELNKHKSPTIALHLRNWSQGDCVFGDASLAWEIFSHDYGMPDQNHLYYSKLYSDLLLRLSKPYLEAGITPQILICSTGSYDDFTPLLKLLDVNHINYEMLLGRPAYDDFFTLVCSDIFVMAKSSLSYLASICSASSQKYIRGGFRHRLPVETHIFKDEEVIYSSKQMQP